MHGAEKKGGLLVCVERKYRYVKLTKLLRRTAEKTAMATIRLLRDFPVRTITNDRGHEFCSSQSSGSSTEYTGILLPSVFFL